MTSKRRSSILKIRNVDNEERDDYTANLDQTAKRRVSFSSKKIKPFAADAEHNTVWDNTYEEDIDSTNSARASFDVVTEKSAEHQVSVFDRTLRATSMEMTGFSHAEEKLVEMKENVFVAGGRNDDKKLSAILWGSKVQNVDFESGLQSTKSQLSVSKNVTRYDKSCLDFTVCKPVGLESGKFTDSDFKNNKLSLLLFGNKVKSNFEQSVFNMGAREAVLPEEIRLDGATNVEFNHSADFGVGGEEKANLVSSCAFSNEQEKLLNLMDNTCDMSLDNDLAEDLAYSFQKVEKASLASCGHINKFSVKDDFLVNESVNSEVFRIEPNNLQSTKIGDIAMGVNCSIMPDERLKLPKANDGKSSMEPNCMANTNNQKQNKFEIFEDEVTLHPAKIMKEVTLKANSEKSFFMNSTNHMSVDYNSSCFQNNTKLGTSTNKDLSQLEKVSKVEKTVAMDVTCTILSEKNLKSLQGSGEKSSLEFTCIADTNPEEQDKFEIFKDEVTLHPEKNTEQVTLKANSEKSIFMNSTNNMSVDYNSSCFQNNTKPDTFTNKDLPQLENASKVEKTVAMEFTCTTLSDNNLKSIKGNGEKSSLEFTCIANTNPEEQDKFEIFEDEVTLHPANITKEVTLKTNSEKSIFINSTNHMSVEYNSSCFQNNTKPGTSTNKDLPQLENASKVEKTVAMEFTCTTLSDKNLKSLKGNGEKSSLEFTCIANTNPEEQDKFEIFEDEVTLHPEKNTEQVTLKANSEKSIIINSTNHMSVDYNSSCFQNNTKPGTSTNKDLPQLENVSKVEKTVAMEFTCTTLSDKNLKLIKGNGEKSSLEFTCIANTTPEEQDKFEIFEDEVTLHPAKITKEVTLKANSEKSIFMNSTNHMSVEYNSSCFQNNTKPGTSTNKDLSQLEKVSKVEKTVAMEFTCTTLSDKNLKLIKGNGEKSSLEFTCIANTNPEEQDKFEIFEDEVTLHPEKNTEQVTLKANSEKSIFMNSTNHMSVDYNSSCFKNDIKPGIELTSANNDLLKLEKDSNVKSVIFPDESIKFETFHTPNFHSTKIETKMSPTKKFKVFEDKSKIIENTANEKPNQENLIREIIGQKSACDSNLDSITIPNFTILQDKTQPQKAASTVQSIDLLNNFSMAPSENLSLKSFLLPEKTELNLTEQVDSFAVFDQQNETANEISEQSLKSLRLPEKPEKIDSFALFDASRKQNDETGHQIIETFDISLTSVKFDQTESVIEDDLDWRAELERRMEKYAKPADFRSFRAGDPTVTEEPNWALKASVNFRARQLLADLTAFSYKPVELEFSELNSRVSDVEAELVSELEARSENVLEPFSIDSTLDDTLPQRLEKLNENSLAWKFLGQENDLFKFNSLCGAISFSLVVDQDERVLDLRLKSNLKPTVNPLKLFGAKTFLDMFSSNKLSSAIGSNYSLMTLLDYVEIVMERQAKFQLFIFTDRMHKMFVDKDFVLHFKILSIELILHLKFAIKLSCIDNIREEDIFVENVIGEINKEELSLVLQNSLKGLEFVESFVTGVQKLVDSKCLGKKK